jgi:hypothetical protein
LPEQVDKADQEILDALGLGGGRQIIRHGVSPY